MNSFGDYLKQLRKAKGMRIRHIEEKTGVSNCYLSQLETGKRGVPSPEMIRKLSSALGVTHIGMMIKAGHVTEDEVLTLRRDCGQADQLPDSFGDALRKIRRLRGFKSQKDFAEASGISQATISRIEDDAQKPSAETLQILSTLLQTKLKGVI